ncbi:uracil-DNA glycosylase [Anseongella ginsenosidimutans]|uniref:Uracil-DNA glycosylase n=1 Tax=Anseongella ginsenosidimutans TaxID=496056 RepID=A0A4R3KQ46_9SPHI|nr:uracil-DNA glycosylase [Anseongella ginsenosidimutans]QEC52657.1 uracil-DNA glycosylase [Anseongella ginsenosidimutans]TCS86584.1 uracil-DNA glycosylase [Anseongella ginsenosidimutans]
MSTIQLDTSWLKYLEGEFSQEYMCQLRAFLQAEKEKGVHIYPPGSLIFNALNTTPFDKVKVVLLGQDPYHGAGQAHGLSFSVQKGIAIPPSLKNIYKELHADLGMEIPPHGDLTSWAEQGVLLLNATLTVQAGCAGSHQKKGWESFTDKIISIVSEEKEGVVFLLWGNYAKAKQPLIDGKKHLILTAAHPSPFSAHYGFLGCRHFSSTNEYLVSQGKDPVDWQIR